MIEKILAKGLTQLPIQRELFSPQNSKMEKSGLMTQKIHQLGTVPFLPYQGVTNVSEQRI